MKKMIPYFLTVILSVGISELAHSRQQSEGQFSDIPQTHWAYHAVMDLAQRGILIGGPDGKLHGDKPMTKIETVMMMDRLLQYMDKTYKQK